MVHKRGLAHENTQYRGASGLASAMEGVKDVRLHGCAHTHGIVDEATFSEQCHAARGCRWYLIAAATTLVVTVAFVGSRDGGVYREGVMMQMEQLRALKVTSCRRGCWRCKISSRKNSSERRAESDALGWFVQGASLPAYSPARLALAKSQKEVMGIVHRETERQKHPDRYHM
jgi:hypothetical protein